MSVSTKDLKPKQFKVRVLGKDYICKPIRMSHTLILSNIGEILENHKDYSSDEILNMQKDLDNVFADLVPGIKDIELDTQSSLDLITQIMESVQPDENKELKDKGVSFETDPKVEQAG